MDKVRKYIRNVEKESIPQLSVNCVIFGFHRKQLMVVVNRFDLGDRSLYLLPGGYVKQNEDLTESVQRVVRLSTGLENILFKQFEVFGNADRSFARELSQVGVHVGGNSSWLQFFMKRFVSVCYLALVHFDDIDLKPTEFLDAAMWLPVHQAKILAMDHAQILRSARASLMKELPHSPVAANLLPARFTLPELQALVEAIVGKKVDRPNFRRKVLNSELLVRVGTDTKGNRRPADLYSFRKGKRNKPATLW